MELLLIGADPAKENLLSVSLKIGETSSGSMVFSTILPSSSTSTHKRLPAKGSFVVQLMRFHMEISASLDILSLISLAAFLSSLAVAFAMHSLRCSRRNHLLRGS